MTIPHSLRTGLSIIAGVAACLAIMSTPAMATDAKDLAIGLKTLPLLENKITGTATTAIVYDPSNAASKADATAIQAAITANPSAPGGVTLAPVMVPVSDMSKLSSAKIAFVAEGAENSFGAIASAASAAGVLTISSDLDCVKGGKCVLGIVSSPDVTIYYSKTAGDAAKISFSPAFTMLVKQI